MILCDLEADCGMKVHKECILKAKDLDGMLTETSLNQCYDKLL